MRQLELKATTSPPSAKEELMHLDTDHAHCCPPTIGLDVGSKRDLVASQADPAQAQQLGVDWMIILTPVALLSMRAMELKYTKSKGSSSPGRGHQP